MTWADRFFYKAYASAYPSGMRRGLRKSTASAVIAGGIIATAIFGLNMQEAIVYQLFALLLSVYLSSYLLSFFFKGIFTVERNLPSTVTAEETFNYTVTVKNHTKHPQKGVLLQESPTLKLPTLQEFAQSRAPIERTLNRWDKMVRYHRFSWLMRKYTRIRPEEHALPDIAPNSQITACIDLTVLHRGYLNLEAVYLKRRDPIGLFKGYIKHDVADRILVLPKRYPVPHINLPGVRKHHAGGVNLASSVGNADEFHSLREYAPGDPMKLLHWKSIAKTGKLIIRENEDEYYVRHALILDTFLESPTTQRFETAVSVAASLTCTVRTQESMLDLMFVENKAYCFSAGRGVDHTSKMMEILACVEPAGADMNFSDLTPLVRSHSSLLSGCILILQTWDEDREKLVNELKARNIPTKILIITEGESFPVDTMPGIHVIDAMTPEEGLSTL